MLGWETSLDKLFNIYKFRGKIISWQDVSFSLKCLIIQFHELGVYQYSQNPLRFQQIYKDSIVNMSKLYNAIKILNVKIAYQLFSESFWEKKLEQ